MKISTTKPTLIMLYGYPGAGKTYFARQLSEDIQLAHVQADRIRHELFESPRYDKQENDAIEQLMDYMTEEFLSAGVSVVYDTNAARFNKRRFLRDVARHKKAEVLLVWLQVDIESAFVRSIKRDRRKADDKYAQQLDRTTFDSLMHTMQNPQITEDYIVLSGKHSFSSQRNAIMKRLEERKLILPSDQNPKIARPNMVNRIPQPQEGRVDDSRRSITIR
jgi:predicted kinase